MFHVEHSGVNIKGCSTWNNPLSYQKILFRSADNGPEFVFYRPNLRSSTLMSAGDTPGMRDA